MGKAVLGVAEEMLKATENILGKEGKKAASSGILKGVEKGLADGMAKNLGKGVEASSNAGKMLSGWDKFKDVGKAAHKVAGGTLRHAKDIAILTTFGWGATQIASGKGLVAPITKGVGGEMAEKYGASGIAAQLVAGQNGEKLLNKVTDTAGNVTDEVGSLYQLLKSGVLNVGNEAADLYQGGKNFLGGFFQGNGMVANGNGGYYDPTTQPYPDMNAVQGMQGQGNGFMDSINQALGNITGGSVSKLNLVGLLASAYMMFGRFGWMSKAAGLALGGMTLKNVNNNHSQQYQAQQQYLAQQQLAQYQATLKAQEDAAAEEAMVVHRSR